MAAPKLRSRRRRDPFVEYSVYIFHRPFHNDNDHITWEKRHTTWSMRSACRHAEKLFKTNAYDKVEVKKKFFDPKIARITDKTLKIYQEDGDRPVGMLAVPLAALMAVSVITALVWMTVHLLG
jgi:hypothetical protein